MWPRKLSTAMLSQELRDHEGEYHYPHGLLTAAADRLDALARENEQLHAQLANRQQTQKGSADQPSPSEAAPDADQAPNPEARTPDATSE